MGNDIIFVLEIFFCNEFVIVNNWAIFWSIPERKYAAPAPTGAAQKMAADASDAVNYTTRNCKSNITL